MKTKNIFKIKFTFYIVAILFTFSNCEREISDQAVLTTFSKDGTIFIDAFSGGLDYFPFGDSFQEAFSVDTKEVYEGSASMRFDIPVFGAGYGGANFPTSSPRDLSGYDALTFWAKASKGATINEIGFGLTESNGNKYRAVRSNLPITTQWRKYIIPIPDPAKLTQETGLLWYAEGAQNATDEGGYTFWLDEVKFEKLGTIAQPRPAILNSQNVVQQTFIGSSITINGLTQTYNLEDGTNPAIGAAPGYFDFETSDASVATVDEFGKVSVVGAGNTTITASIGGVTASGSLQLESLGPFTPAPTPTQPASNVISIFSDAYTNVNVDFYNGYYAPFQTTQGQDDIEINGDNIIKYTQLNFVGIEFKNPTINAANMAFLHVDIQVENPISPGDFVTIEVADFGADRVFGGGDDSSGRVRIDGSRFTTKTWLSLDLPLASFNLANKTNLGQMLFITDGTNPTIPGKITDVLVDNIYLYRNTSPTVPFNFDNASVDYSFATFNGASFAVVDNPQLSGINATPSKVGRFINSGNNFEGGAVGLESPVNFSNGNKIKIKVYATTAIPVLLKFEGGANGAANIETVANHTGSGWEELEFTFSSSAQYSTLVLFMDGPGNTSGTFYIDDVIQTN